MLKPDIVANLSFKDPNDLPDRVAVTDGKPMIIVTEAFAREILAQRFSVKKEYIRRRLYISLTQNIWSKYQSLTVNIFLFTQKNLHISIFGAIFFSVF